MELEGHPDRSIRAFQLIRHTKKKFHQSSFDVFIRKGTEKIKSFSYIQGS